jgi:regulator of sigma E protease
MIDQILYAALALALLIVVHELGHFLVAKRVRVGVLKFSIGFGPRVLGKRVGETEYLLSAIPLGGYVKMLGEDPEEKIEPALKERSFSIQTLWKRTAIVLAGPGFNLLLAVGLFTIVFFLGVPVLTTKVGEVRKGFPAEQSDLRVGDEITFVNGERVRKWEDLSERIRNSGGKPIHFLVLRQGREIPIVVVPHRSESQTLFREKEETWIIGVAAGREVLTERLDPISALVQGVSKTAELSYLTLVALIKMVQRVIPADSIGGPILIVQMAGRQAKEGWSHFLFFVAVLSVNLGVLNLLPVPILDGGHLLFFLIEKFRGKPLDLRVREIAQQVGLFLLILLMVFAFYNDVSRIFQG